MYHYTDYTYVCQTVMKDGSICGKRCMKEKCSQHLKRKYDYKPCLGECGRMTISKVQICGHCNR